MAPVLIPCSRNAHDQNVLVRRPQWDLHGCHSTGEKEASKLGGIIQMDAVRWTRAVRDIPRSLPEIEV
jgi:hypothetical protein